MKTSHLPQLALAVLGVLTLAVGCEHLSAAPIMYSGNFANANELYQVNFTTSTTANLSILTSSIAPPTEGAQLVLWLFNSSGTTQLAKNDPPDDTEAAINISEPAGTYLLDVSVFDQHYCAANTVCNGVVYGNTGWSYNGAFFSDDSTAYAFSISADAGTLTQNSAAFDLNPTQAFPVATPEPCSAGLFVIGSGLLVWRRKRTRSV